MTPHQPSRTDAADLVALRLGEPKVAVWPGGDAFGVAGRGPDREFGDDRGWDTAASGAVGPARAQPPAQTHHAAHIQRATTPDQPKQPEIHLCECGRFEEIASNSLCNSHCTYV